MQINCCLKYCTLLLSLTLSVISSAQFTKFDLKHISQEHGLPGVSGRQIMQDSKGLIWIGVESYGLAKYDGYRFELFSHNEEDSTTLCGNVIEAFCEDNESNIWCGTESGLCFYNRNTNKFKTFKRTPNSSLGIPGSSIRALKRTLNGDIWIATENGATLFSASTKRFTHFLTNKEKRISVTDIALAKDGTVWFSTNNGLYKMPSDSNIVNIPLYDNSARQAIKYINELAVFSDTSLLIGSGMKLFDYNTKNQSFKEIPIIDSLNKGPFSEITDIIKDKRGNVWISTTVYGVSVYFPETGFVENYQPDCKNPQSLKHYAVRDLYVDKSGLVWIVMKFKGIQSFSYQSQIIEHYYREGRDKDMLHSKDIISMLADDEDKIWIGSSNGGIHFFDPQKKTIRHQNCRQFPVLNNMRINAIAQSKDGKVWIGTPYSLYVSDNKLNDVEKIAEDAVIDIACDDANTIWVASRHGIHVYYKGRYMNFDEYAGYQTDLESYPFKTITAGSKGNIWFGSFNKGLFLFNKFTKELNRYTNNTNDSKSISANLIRGIHEDDKGTVWITTKNIGLNRFNWKDSTFTRFSQRNGLPINTLFGIIQDSSRNLWISSFQGICKFNLDTYKTENFTKEYGLQNDIFEPNAIAANSKGDLFFGGDNGFNQFSPYTLKQVKKSVPLIFTSINIFEKQIYSDLTESVTIKLKHYENQISFNFSLLDYSTALGKQYIYKLEGFDKKWTHTNDRHFVSYTNLSPGTYTFKLSGQTKDGFTNSNDIKITLIIEAPIWRRLWFQITAALLLIGTIFGGFRLKLHKEKQHSKNLEILVKVKTQNLISKHKEVTEKKKELEEKTHLLEQQTQELIDKTNQLELTNNDLAKANSTKNKMVSIIAHDLKNQFNPIMNLSMILAQEAEELETEQLIEELKLISSSANSALGVLENLLLWYRNQKGDLVPKYEETRLFDIFETMKSLYDIAAKQKHIKLELSVDENLTILTDKHMLKAIIRNLLNNAIKFTPKKGSIKLNASAENAMINISISDSGCGMNNEQKKYLFDFDSDKHKKAEGSGIGLQICKDFIEALNGKLTIASEPEKGSCFTVSLKRQ